MSNRISVLCAFTLFAGAGVFVSATACAQTQGMERRDDRQNNRQDARAQKQACKAGDEKSRAECRHTKREAKHTDQPAPASQSAAK